MERCNAVVGEALSIHKAMPDWNSRSGTRYHKVPLDLNRSSFE